MATAQKTLLRDVSVKRDTGDLTSPVYVGTTFEDTIDSRRGKTPYTLAQFFDHYLNFMQNADFIYYGSVKPTNNHVKLWLDTSTNNQSS